MMLFSDGGTTKKTSPVVAAPGISYVITPGLLAEIDLTNYFNKLADWDGEEENYIHGWQSGIALEYDVSPELKVSIGYSFSERGARDAARSEMSMHLNGHFISLGSTYAVSPVFDVTFSILRGIYNEVTIISPSLRLSYLNLSPPGTQPGMQKQNQDLWVFAIGLTYKVL